MATLTAATNYKIQTQNGVTEWPASSLTCKAGALIGLRSGVAILWDDTEGDIFLGRAISGVSSASSVKVRNTADLIELIDGAAPAVGGTLTSQAVDGGALIYCSSDNPADATITAGNVPVGKLVKYLSSTTAQWRMIPSFASGSDVASLDVDGALTVGGAASVTGATTTTGGIVDAGGITTTRGVSSGTALKVGGLASSAVAASTAVTNTATETAFDNSSYEIPANSLTQGARLMIYAQGIATSTNSTNTLEILVYAGSTELFSTGPLDVANNEAFSIIGMVKARAAPGAAAACVGFAQICYGTDEEAQTGKHSIMPSTNLATNGALTINIRAKWSVANAGNSCRLDICDYDVIG